MKLRNCCAALTSRDACIVGLWVVVTMSGRFFIVVGPVRSVACAGSDNWDCYDDDVVSACRTEDVMALKGGGDYDMASMLFYRAK